MAMLSARASNPIVTNRHSHAKSPRSTPCRQEVNRAPTLPPSSRKIKRFQETWSHTGTVRSDHSDLGALSGPARPRVRPRTPKTGPGHATPTRQGQSGERELILARAAPISTVIGATYWRAWLPGHAGVPASPDGSGREAVRDVDQRRESELNPNSGGEVVASYAAQAQNGLEV